MEFVDGVEVQLSYGHSCVWVGQGDEMPIFGEFIYDNQNSIVFMRFGESIYEVKANNLPSLGGNRQGLK
jgi:hypothetical protein